MLAGLEQLRGGTDHIAARRKVGGTGARPVPGEMEIEKRMGRDQQ
jgi:hypothetical protein